MSHIYVIEASAPISACVIWMHGLGANAQDMMGLAQQLSLGPSVRHVCMDAPIRSVTLNNHLKMRAWYDILGLERGAQEDKKGVLESEQRIQEVIEQQRALGIKSEQIYLAGFSQGGAMALYAGLHASQSLGGVVALSAYVPLIAECSVRLNRKTPFFIGYGALDALVLPEWSKQSVAFLEQHGFQHVTAHAYSMGHAICAEEVRDLANWFTTQCNASLSDAGAPL